MIQLNENKDSFLDIKNLSLEYIVNKNKFTPVKNISFKAKEYERLVLLGPSGCGKSTILKAVGGFIKPANGKIVLEGEEITKPSIDRAFVFQEFDQLLAWKTVLQNVVFAITITKRFKKNDAEDLARVFLKKVNLSAFENSYPHQLSGGMKMRVAIARCLALGSKMILMDEPFASLDAITRKKMQDDLLSLWEDSKFTMLFVTHSIDEAIKLGTKIIILSSNGGQIKKEITVNSFTTKEEISSIMYKNIPEYFI